MTDIHTIGTRPELASVTTDDTEVMLTAEGADADCTIGLTPRQARALAVALLQAADELD